MFTVKTQNQLEPFDIEKSMCKASNDCACIKGSKQRPQVQNHSILTGSERSQAIKYEKKIGSDRNRCQCNTSRCDDQILFLIHMYL